ncbi:Hypothetical_protein [Hexamita inflata]|uniref:Hypothetical_protein n=1 Tax=Hexamita inflata TaxID=28002 RepID=A0AA86QAW7_9EUKA|nr:Hypothetical protein HINF_LOCUS41261 [Hexamita inflata]
MHPLIHSKNSHLTSDAKEVLESLIKIDYYIRENGDQITKSKLEQIIGKINAKMTKSKNFFRDTLKEMKIQEKISIQVDDTVPKPGYTLLGRRRMDNTAFIQNEIQDKKKKSLYNRSYDFNASILCQTIKLGVQRQS